MSEWGYSTHDKGGYFFDARAEKESWDKLTSARSDWLLHDARAWYKRLCEGPALDDLKVGRVKLYMGVVLSVLDKGGV